jgi:SAM-dependent methyltransferase
MASVIQNLEVWSNYDWERRGEEWSTPWGSSRAQWAVTIYPRIAHLLPAASIVEIAFGFGRWVPYLLNYTADYTGVELAERCATFCSRSFGPLSQRPRFLLGDGLSLPVPDASTSLVFSFDSLVHVEQDCIDAYAHEIARVLRPGGSAFLHHSNAGQFCELNPPGWRGASVSAESAAAAFDAAGLRVRMQETVPWTFENLLFDCFSLLEKPAQGETAAVAGPVVANERFAEEIRMASEFDARYLAR